MHRLGVTLGLGVVLAAGTASAETVVVQASSDSTLIEDAEGLLANGTGPDVFAGRNSQPSGSIRRGLLRFDLEAIPRGAVVEAVRLHLFVNQAAARVGEMRVHRLEASWSEGPSFATGGGGTPSAAGDATWIHRLFDPERSTPAAAAASLRARPLWLAPGGDFAEEPSAVMVTPGVGPRVVEGPGLVADVQAWVAKPQRNDGWILVGDEAGPTTARRIASRENMLLDQRPRLEVVYRRR